MADASLDGITVLVTRPQQQAGELVDAINAAGGSAIAFPVIEIRARSAAAVAADAAALPPPDISIFISRNAVEHGLDYAAGQLAAIGPTTAAAIRDAGGSVDICPATGFDSEHLLDEPAFQELAGKNVRIVRGNAGRELLADMLRQRGARVDYLSTYERTLPQYSDQALLTLEKRWAGGEIDAVVIMSVQSLQNLAALLPDTCAKRLRSTPLVTPAARVLKEAESAFSGAHVTLANGPTTSEILDALTRIHS